MARPKKVVEGEVTEEQGFVEETGTGVEEDVKGNEFGSITKDEEQKVPEKKEILKKSNDFEIIGDVDMWKILCKVIDQKEGWMKSTKACEIVGSGCLVQVSTQKNQGIAESITFVPRVKLAKDVKGGYKLVSF